MVELHLSSKKVFPQK
ncbi:hypothetical protein FWK35_00021490 [Aphis craccivora]|nr:hypothetical protein FWK35_00029781 [Aphis craccivora]KAF0745889.1 hypothetical protein FWK35_00032153 [Aphis craccivora]KAF0751609.1 hypothetical protein FWK35_00018341 [Aphis craccivora]KAF0752441.1 hypothetical protein FWK35_00021490 [Aphis craccivora]